VYPAGVSENCTLLAPAYDEIALAFFETEACLAYTDADLPAGLAKLPVSWHIHLPLDLPWERGSAHVAGVILALIGRAAHLSPGALVLHPPATPQQLDTLARALADGGVDPGRVLVENIAGDDLARMWPVICRRGLGVCLDLGHMLVHGREDFLSLPGLAERCRMAHLNAPDPDKPGRHASLSILDAAGRALCARLLSLLPPGGVAVLELFNAAALAESRRELDALAAAASPRREDA
jgi:hypothetical protein